MKNEVEVLSPTAWFRIFQYAFNIRVDETTADCTGMEAILDTLSDRECDVLKWRFDDQLHVEEIGTRLGVSRGRVHQILARIRRRLHHPMRRQLILSSVTPNWIFREDVLERDHPVLQRAHDRYRAKLQALMSK